MVFHSVVLFCFVFFPKKKVFLFFVLLFVNRIDTLTRTEIIMMLITKCCLLMIICKCGDKVMLWCLDVATLRDVASWYQSADKYSPFFVRGYAITKSYAVLLCCAKTKITIAHTISGHNNCSSWNRSYCSAAAAAAIVVLIFYFSESRWCFDAFSLTCCVAFFVVVRRIGLPFRSVWKRWLQLNRLNVLV